MTTKPTSVGDYIDSFPDEARALLRELRELSRTSAPEAAEELKWGHPAYSTGTILFVFSGHRNHANIVFTPSTLQAFLDRLGDHRTGKGSVQLPYEEPIPTDLLREMIAHRIREYDDEGVTWM